MISFNVWQFGLVIEKLQDLHSGALNHCTFHANRDLLVPKEMIEKVIVPWLNYGRRMCEAVELTAAIARIDQFETTCEIHLTYSELEVQTRVLREAIEDELRLRRFAFVPTERANKLDNIDKYWASVQQQFPSAKEDIRSAVECYALDCNTACVFHLMRVAEYGLRALARERRVKLPKNRPLEWAEWNDVISGIIKKTDALANQRRGPARDAALGFTGVRSANFRRSKMPIAIT